MHLMVCMPSPPLPPVCCDPTLLRIVTVNLLDNAVKYGNEGGDIRVKAEVFFDRKLGERLRISVWNSGPGFDTAQQDKLFRRFSRLDDPAIKTRRGTGVGYARVATDEPRQRCCRRSQQPEGKCGRGRGRAQEPDERHLDNRCEWHPVGVRGDGQHALGGQCAADLDEVPDVVDAEAAARRQLAAEIRVVQGVGVRRLHEEGRHRDAHDERDHEQQDGDRHVGATLATAARTARWYGRTMTGGPRGQSGALWRVRDGTMGPS